MPSLPATPFGNEAGDLELPRYRPISFYEGVAQFLALRGILQQSFANLGVGGDVCIDHCDPLRRQPAIQAGLQIYLADGAGNVHHRARLGSLIRSFCPPVIYWRSRSRPRDNRDITVPIGTASTPAASSYDRSSTPIRKSTDRCSSDNSAKPRNKSRCASAASCLPSLRGSSASVQAVNSSCMPCRPRRRRSLRNWL